MQRFEPSPGSIAFSLGGIPTIIRPTSWLVLLILGSSGSSSAMLDIVGTLIFVAMGMLCLLVHEYGHAFSCRALGGGESVVEIASLGGVTISSYPPRTRMGHILMILAGPGASLALGLLGGLALGVQIGDVAGGLLAAVYLPLSALLPTSDLLMEHFMYPLYQAGLSHFVLECYFTLFFVCMWWSIFNLLPIFPLDGGKSLYLLTNNARLTSTVGVVVSILLCLWGLISGNMFNAFLCAYLVYVNWQYMKSNR